MCQLYILMALGAASIHADLLCFKMLPEAFSTFTATSPLYYTETSKGETVHPLVHSLLSPLLHPLVHSLLSLLVHPHHLI